MSLDLFTQNLGHTLLTELMRCPGAAQNARPGPVDVLRKIAAPAAWELAQRDLVA